jgi:hypothetical protein
MMVSTDPGETRDQWDRRCRDRRRVRPEDIDPLGTCVVTAHHRHVVAEDRPYSVPGALPLVVEYDELSDKRTWDVVARRFPDGRIEFTPPSRGDRPSCFARRRADDRLARPVGDAPVG